jgi:hypothetical protein
MRPNCSLIRDERTKRYRYRDARGNLQTAIGETEGTNFGVALWCGGPAIPLPLPRAWPAIWGAADMPIGCAFTFLIVIRRQTSRQRSLGELRKV